MSEPNTQRCIVLLPPGPRFARLFNEILTSTLIEAGLIPLLVQRTTKSSLPPQQMVDRIERTDVVLADLSEDSPQIWFALGYAAALGKPLCLIARRSDSLSHFATEQPIFLYPAEAFPSDYLDLQQSILRRLAQFVSAPYDESLSWKPAEAATYALNEPPAADRRSHPQSDSQDQSANADDLVSYEALALSIIDRKATESGLSPRDLGLEMRDNESTHLTSHAMNALRRRGFIERRPVSLTTGTERFISDNLFLTPLGEQWLNRNGRRTGSRTSKAPTGEIFQGV